jgi:hypothetical protein
MEIAGGIMGCQPDRQAPDSQKAAPGRREPNLRHRPTTTVARRQLSCTRTRTSRAAGI